MTVGQIRQQWGKGLSGKREKKVMTPPLAENRRPMRNWRVGHSRRCTPVFPIAVSAASDADDSAENARARLGCHDEGST